MNFRRILEILSRGIVLRKKIEGKKGNRKIYVSPEAGLRFWKPGLKHTDDMMENVIQNYIKDDFVVWDIGANMGLFSFNVQINYKNVKCLMVEPDIWLCNLIRRSALKNPDWKIDLIPMAVSSRTGLATFNIAERSRQTNFLAGSEGSSQTGGIRHSLTVPTITLDSLYEEYDAPDFIKIDVEGAETFVIEGGLKLFKNNKPIIMCECSESSYLKIVSMLNSDTYNFYDAEAIPVLKPFNGHYSQNFIAIPKKKQ